MKMKYSEIIVNRSVLMEIGKFILPRKVSVAIARNLTRLDKEMKLYGEQENDIASRYAKKDEDGKIIFKGEKKNELEFETTENLKSFQSEKKELNETEVEIEIMKFKSSELDRCEEVDRYKILTPVQEAAIGWMIDYDDETE